MKILSSSHWTAQVLATILLGAGVLEQSRALRHMHLADGYADFGMTSLAIVGAAICAFTVGRRVSLTLLADLPASLWFLAAIGIALCPSLLQWAINETTSNNLGFYGSRIDVGRYSLLLYFGGVAALRYANAAEVTPQRHGLLQPLKWNFLILNAVWMTSLMLTGTSLLLVLVWLMTAALVTRKTAWFFTSVVSVLVPLFAISAILMCKGYLLRRFLHSLIPFDDPLGRGFVPSQVRASLSEAGWFGTDVIYFIPGAVNKFQLTVIGSHLGWLVLFCIVIVLATLLATLYFSLCKLQNCWARHFGLAVWGLVSCYSTINVLANLGWIAPAAGTPFLSREMFLSTCTALLIGLSMREKWNGGNHA